MLKCKRKINKAILIASSRRYLAPLPKAYTELLRRGVVVRHRTKFCDDWRKAALCL